MSWPYCLFLMPQFSVLRASTAVFTLLLMSVLNSGCGPRLNMTRINSAQRKPNNIWVFFTVQKGSEPVPNLRAEDFEIYEDDSLVSPYESQQIIQNPQVGLG